MWRKYAPKPVELELDVSGLDYNFGDVVRYQSADSLGGPDAIIPVRLSTMRHNPMTKRTIWQGEDFSRPRALFEAEEP